MYSVVQGATANTTTFTHHHHHKRMEFWNTGNSGIPGIQFGIQKFGIQEFGIQNSLKFRIMGIPKYGIRNSKNSILINEFWIPNFPISKLNSGIPSISGIPPVVVVVVAGLRHRVWRCCCFWKPAGVVSTSPHHFTLTVSPINEGRISINLDMWIKWPIRTILHSLNLGRSTCFQIHKACPWHPKVLWIL